MNSIVATKARKGDILRDSAFEAYMDTRDIENAYKQYMQDNAAALTSIRTFTRWASDDKWVSKSQSIDAEEELRITQQTRRQGLSNSLSAEEMCEELTRTCMEEFQLHRSEMSHRDISRYLKIADDIAARWSKGDTPQVVVNVESKGDTVEVDAETLRNVGRALSMEDDE